MSRFMSVVWVVQFFALLALSTVLLVSPQAVPVLLDHCTYSENQHGDERLYELDTVDRPMAERRECGVDPASAARLNTAEQQYPAWREVRFILAGGRLMAPFTFLLAIFSIHAFLREDLRVRRRLARIFALTGSLFVFFLLFPPHLLFPTQVGLGGQPTQPSTLFEHLHHPLEHPCFHHLLLLESFALLVFLVASNVALSLWPLPPAARRLSGSADTRPASLWVLWLVQGLLFTLAAVFLTRFGAERWVLGGPDGFLYVNVLEDFRQLMPPLFLAMGLLSFAGMRASREWGWRAFSRLFVLFYGASILALLLVWDTTFNPLLFVFLTLPMLLLLLGNLRYWNRSDTWFAEEVGEGPDGWVAPDLLIGCLLMMRTLFTRRRALYPRGVACRGTFQVAAYQEDTSYGEKLEHEFFPRGQGFEARVRFATEGRDEAALALRGVALQLDTPGRGSFDLLMGTGAYSPAENLVEFAQLYTVRALGGFLERLFWKYRPRMREGLIAGLRRAPDSYAKLHYHSQTVRFWVARNGTRHLVRYRLVPDTQAPEQESGLPPLDGNPEQELARRRLKDERRPADYLQQELKRRLEGEDSTCALRLEAQFHSPDPGDSTHWFNPSVDWRTNEHPWVCLGRLTLEEIIPDAQTELLCFNPANVPPSLGTPTSGGIFDYRSIADSEKRVHRRIQRARQWMTEALGDPT